MRTIDAFWDTRSLGVKTAELDFSAEDGEAEVNESLAFAGSYEYVAAKVQAGNMIVLHALQEANFTFMECSIEVTIELVDFELSGMAKRFDKHITIERASETSKERIYRHIRSGIFETDRIALDPAFSKEIAAERYISWIEDELARGGELYHIFYKEDEVGFFSYKETIPGVEAFPFLAGLYNEFRTSGIGLNVAVATEAKFSHDRGCKRIRTYVSSNNLPILRIHEMLGYKVSNIKYVLVRHSEARSF